MLPAPPAADIAKVTTPKPAIVGDIVNDDTASAMHSAKVETWGDTVSAAGRRLCRWFVANGAKVTCPDAPR